MAHRTAFRVAAIAAAVALGLGASECAVRLVAPQPLVGPLHEELLGVIAPIANARIRFSSPGQFDTRVSINSEHFRAHFDFTSVPAPHVRRIAMLGDSMTFGYGVNDDETYPTYLEQRLNRSWPVRRHGSKSSMPASSEWALARKHCGTNVG